MAVNIRVHVWAVFKSLEAIKQLNSLTARFFVIGVKIYFLELILGELLILVYFKYVWVVVSNAMKIEWKTLFVYYEFFSGSLQLYFFNR